jgi:hypothetical protein
VHGLIGWCFCVLIHAKVIALPNEQHCPAGLFMCCHTGYTGLLLAHILLLTHMLV